MSKVRRSIIQNRKSLCKITLKIFRKYEDQYSKIKNFVQNHTENISKIWRSLIQNGKKFVQNHTENISKIWRSVLQNRKRLCKITLKIFRKYEVQYSKIEKGCAKSHWKYFENMKINTPKWKKVVQNHTENISKIWRSVLQNRKKLCKITLKIFRKYEDQYSKMEKG